MILQSNEKCWGTNYRTAVLRGISPSFGPQKHLGLPRKVVGVEPRIWWQDFLKSVICRTLWMWLKSVGQEVRHARRLCIPAGNRQTKKGKWTAAFDQMHMFPVSTDQHWCCHFFLCHILFRVASAPFVLSAPRDRRSAFQSEFLLVMVTFIFAYIKLQNKNVFPSFNETGFTGIGGSWGLSWRTWKAWTPRYSRYWNSRLTSKCSVDYLSLTALRSQKRFLMLVFWKVSLSIQRSSSNRQYPHQCKTGLSRTPSSQTTFSALYQCLKAFSEQCLR